MEYGGSLATGDLETNYNQGPNTLPLQGEEKHETNLLATCLASVIILGQYLLAEERPSSSSRLLETVDVLDQIEMGHTGSISFRIKKNRQSRH